MFAQLQYPMQKKEKIILLLLATLNFTHILDFMIMMPLGNHLIPYFQISGQKFSVILASYSVSACIASLIASFFVDNFDRKKVLLFGYTGFLTCTILCGLAPTANTLTAARIIAGLFGGLIGAQVLSIVADTFPYERRGTAMGYLMTAFSVASIIGVPMGLLLADKFSWHAPFLLVGGMGVLVIPLLIRFIPTMNFHLINRPDTNPGFTLTLQHVFAGKKQMIALMFSAFLMMGHFLIIPFITPYMEFNVGFERSQIKSLSTD
jgi:predicted MFS family arabinose efflux permease